MNEEAIRNAITSTMAVSFDPEAAWVGTQCLYPSNATVILRITGGRETFAVSDDGGAVREALAAGVRPSDVRGVAARIAGPQGLMVLNDQISSPPVGCAELSGAAILVANASQEVAHWLLSHVKIRPQRNFRKALADLLDRNFGSELRHHLPFVGASTKVHKFEHVAHLSERRQVLIDPVINEASSINARVVANMDIRQAKMVGVEQRIIYDDAEDWASSDLTLLQIGAPIVPFSQVEPVIQRLKRAA